MNLEDVKEGQKVAYIPYWVLARRHDTDDLLEHPAVEYGTVKAKNGYWVFVEFDKSSIELPITTKACDAGNLVLINESDKDCQTDTTDDAGI